MSDVSISNLVRAQAKLEFLMELIEGDHTSSFLLHAVNGDVVTDCVTLLAGYTVPGQHCNIRRLAVAQRIAKNAVFLGPEKSWVSVDDSLSLLHWEISQVLSLTRKVRAS